LGPEQADAAIDQDPRLSQFFAWWSRQGLDVVRGHTMLLPIEDEVLYVEPIFLRSRQQQVTQLKKVVVVYRGRPVMRDSLEEALRAAVAGEPSSEALPPGLDPGPGPGPDPGTLTVAAGNGSSTGFAAGEDVP
ncbi:MAG TPA: hypothetical protein VML75_04500, partial [Kofleriaceae bacterium]|nr:hypothetical protein [Kofleriaceae bacterium]